jgi:hypothetical protein
MSRSILRASDNAVGMEKGWDMLRPGVSQQIIYIYI